MDILYISDMYVCLGCDLTTISLTERQEYIFEFRAGIRVITARCIVMAVLVEGARVSVICRFESLKPEDKRFLYEKHYGAMLQWVMQKLVKNAQKILNKYTILQDNVILSPKNSFNRKVHLYV